jgi:hypothetical protein
MDYASDQIRQYEERPSIPYSSPAFQVTPQFGPFGVPYWMQGFPMQTCNMQTITAPLPYQKSKITHAVGQSYRHANTAIGQAPTSGIYTGVEDSCT